MKIRKVFSVIAGLALLSPLVAQRKPAAAAPAARPAAPAPVVATTGSVTGSSAQGVSGKVKRFSVDVSAGLKGNMANLGDTITKDGTIDTNSGTLIRQAYSTNTAIMSDRNNAAILYNSNNTNSAFNLLSGYTDGGPLTGIDIGTNLKYDLDDLINLPLFIRGGFSYMMKLSGGSQSRTLGNVTSGNAALNALLLSQTGKAGSEYAGGTMSTTFGASWMEIPLAVGFNARISDSTKIYVGVGASYFYGGWDVKLAIDEKYANAMATYTDLSTTATNYWAQQGGGSIDETITFRASGIGVNYFMGLEQNLTKDLSLFMEIYASGFAKTVYSSELSTKGQRLMTATSSSSLYQGDNQWFKRLAFPVVLGGASIKVGVKYYIF